MSHNILHAINQERAKERAKERDEKRRPVAVVDPVPNKVEPTDLSYIDTNGFPEVQQDSFTGGPFPDRTTDPRSSPWDYPRSQSSIPQELARMMERRKLMEGFGDTSTTDTREAPLYEPEYPSGVHQIPEQREKGWFSPPTPTEFFDTTSIGGAIKGVFSGGEALAEQLIGGAQHTVTGKGFKGESPKPFSLPWHTTKENEFISTIYEGIDPSLIRDRASHTFDISPGTTINDPDILNEMKETQEAKSILKLAREHARQPSTTAEAVTAGIFSFGASQPPLTIEEINRMHPILQATMALPPVGAFLGRLIQPGVVGGLTRELGRDIGNTARFAFSSKNIPVLKNINVDPKYFKLALKDPDSAIAENALPPSSLVPSVASKTLGLQPIQPRITRGEQLMLLVKGKHKDSGIHEQVNPAMEELKRGQRNVEHLASAFSQKHHASLNDAFPINKNTGQVRGLGGIDNTVPGAPTIADIAARFPKYKPYLTTDQINALMELKEALKPYRQILEEGGSTIGTRTDVIDGGFYIPRSGVKGKIDEFAGTFDDDGIFLDIGTKVKQGTRTDARTGRTSRYNVRSGYERTAYFDSQVEGIKAGYSYPSVIEALEGYVRQVGNRGVNRHVESYLANLTDINGDLIVRTPASKVDPNLRNRVLKLKNQISGARKTLGRQNVREAEKIRDVVRLQSQAKASGERLTKAEGRLPGYSEGTLGDIVRPGVKYEDTLKENLTLARSELSTTTEEALTMSRRIGEDIQKLKQANRLKSATEHKLLKQKKELDEAVRDGNASLESDIQLRRESKRPNLGGLSRTVGSHYKKADNITRIMDRNNIHWWKLSEKVDELIEGGTVHKDILSGARANMVAGRRSLRDAHQEFLLFHKTKREIKMLTLEHNRMKKQVAGGDERALNAQRRAVETEENIRKLQDDLDEIFGEYKKSVERSRTPSVEEARINMGGLQDKFFPKALAEAANKVLKGDPKVFGDAAEGLTMYNQVLVGLNATADNSAPGIQGLLALAASPRAWGKAMKTNWLAWGRDGDRVLGRMMHTFDLKAKSQGLLTSDMWASFELRIGGANIGEQMLGEGISSGLARLPVIRQSNRAFGFFGDALRLEWADDMLRNELALGKTVQQLRDNGDLHRIAEITNNMTGYSHKRAGGALGDVALFAPRFLQARLSTISKAAMGLRPGATLDQRIARKTILKTVGYSVLLTNLINWIQGRETDYRLFVDGEMNPNFNRARIFGRDVSLLGPYDWIAKGIVLTGMGKPEEAIRPLLGPIARTAWDIGSGETAIGTPTRGVDGRLIENLTSEETAFYMMKSLMPFSGQEIPDIVEALSEGEILEAATTLTAEIHGVKSGALSFRDIQFDVSRELYPDIPPDKLDKDQRRRVMEDDRMKKEIEKIEERKASYPTGFPISMEDKLNAVWGDIERVDETTENKLKDHIDAGMHGRDLRLKISEFKRNRFIQREAFFSPELEKYHENIKADKFRPIRDVVRDSYWEIDAPEDKGTGVIDFDYRDSERLTILEKAMEAYDLSNEDIEYIKSRTPYDDPMIEAYISELEDDREDVRPYLEIGKTIAEEDGVLDLYLKYIALSSDNQAVMKQRHPELIWVDLKVQHKKLEFRQNEVIERKLYKWGWIDSPINYNVLKDIERLRKEQGGMVTNRFGIDPNSVGAK